MNKPLIIILMGSKTDQEHCTKIESAAREFGLDVVTRIGSAHKTPEHLTQLLREYENMPRPKVYITVAGRSNALSGFTDGSVTAPVIACPPVSETFGGGDIYSSLRMPSGIAPAIVLDPSNAALLAAKILGFVDQSVQAKVVEFQKMQAEKILKDDQAIQGK